MQKDLELFNKLAHHLFNKECLDPVAKPIDTKSLYDVLDLSLSENPINDKEFSSILEDIITYTPKTASTSFYNQLFGGRLGKATLGELLAALLNNSMYTYKVAGPQVGIEKSILNKVCELIGYPTIGDGTFAPGGSMSNYMGMVMARDKYDPDARYNGITKPLIAYTSSASHYSITKNAALCGLGRNQVRLVNTTDNGELCTKHLEALILEDLSHNLKPFFVNATAGTTVLGAFDNVSVIADICSKHDLWLHLDGAYCGAVIFSDKYKHLVKGIESTDSFSINAHKMLGTPLSCSIIVTNNKKYLHDSFSNDAEYLYQTDGDEYNLGKTSIQCGRRNDALKLWTLWKSVGSKGLTQIVNHQFDMANLVRDYIRQNKDYTLYSFEDSISICFNYKNIPAALLCTSLYENSELMVGYGKFNNNEFIRLVTINTLITKKDISHFFKTLESHAEKLEYNN
jgi:glutamate/tyrosine decarboxylase-like PLP-dependent enzyme